MSKTVESKTVRSEEFIPHIVINHKQLQHTGSAHFILYPLSVYPLLLTCKWFQSSSSDLAALYHLFLSIFLNSVSSFLQQRKSNFWQILLCIPFLSSKSISLPLLSFLSLMGKTRDIAGCRILIVYPQFSTDHYSLTILLLALCNS